MVKLCALAKLGRRASPVSRSDVVARNRITRMNLISKSTSGGCSMLTSTQYHRTVIDHVTYMSKVLGSSASVLHTEAGKLVIFNCLIWVNFQIAPRTVICLADFLDRATKGTLKCQQNAAILFFHLNHAVSLELSCSHGAIMPCMAWCSHV